MLYELELKLKQQQGLCTVAKVRLPALRPCREESALAPSLPAFLSLPTRPAEVVSCVSRSHALHVRHSDAGAVQVTVSRGIGNHYALVSHQELA